MAAAKGEAPLKADAAARARDGGKSGCGREGLGRRRFKGGGAHDVSRVHLRQSEDAAPLRPAVLSARVGEIELTDLGAEPRRKSGEIPDHQIGALNMSRFRDMSPEPFRDLAMAREKWP